MTMGSMHQKTFSIRIGTINQNTGILKMQLGRS